MKIELNQQIKANPILYNYLRDYYKNLYRNREHIKVIEQLAKEKYKLRSVDKIEKLKNNIDLIKTFMDVLN